MPIISPINQPLEFLLEPHIDANVKSDRAYQEMERMFLTVMLKEMRRTVPEEGLFGESPGKKIFEEMLDEVFASKMAESGQFGIAKAIKEQVALQESQPRLRRALQEQREHAAPIPLEMPQPAAGPKWMDLPPRAGEGRGAQFIPFQDVEASDFIPLKAIEESADKNEAANTETSRRY